MSSEFCRFPYLVVVIPLDQMNLVLAAKAYVLWSISSRGAERGDDFRRTQSDFVRYGRALLLSRLRHHRVGLAVQTSSVTASADAIVVCAWAPENGTPAVKTIAGK